MTWHNKVMWTEGMFLQPQHFQQQDRYVARQLEGRLSAAGPWPWGFVALQVDEPALLQGRVAISGARGVLPDGVAFSVPGDDPAPPAFEVPGDVRDQVVVLAVPMSRPGVPESDVEASDGSMPPRFRANDIDVADSHAASLREAPLQIGRLNLRLMLAPAYHNRYDEVPVIKTVASQNEGVNDLLKQIEHQAKHHHSKEKKYWLLTERAFQLIQRKRMHDIDKEKLKEKIITLSNKNSFSLYSFIKNY